MKIEYVCHACLLIETEDLRIGSDHWLGGANHCPNVMHLEEKDSD